MPVPPVSPQSPGPAGRSRPGRAAGWRGLSGTGGWRLALGLTLAVLAAGPVAAQQGQGAPPVEVAAPLQQEVVDYNVYTGRFEAVDKVEIRSRVSGYLDKISFNDGQMVQAGDLLFTIDQRTFNAAVERAEAQLAASKAGRHLAEVENDRAKQLAARRIGTVQDAQRTAAALLQANAEVHIAEAELRQAQLDLDFTEIRAPITGRMSDARVDPGNLVIGEGTGATLLSTIVSIDPIYFVFTTSEADYLRYVRGGREEGMTGAGRNIPVSIRLMDEDDFVHEGRMDFLDNALDPNSGTITGRAVLPNPDGFLTPGVFGRLKLPVSKPYLALLIPDEAILSDQARKMVMIVDDEDTVVPRTVTLGALYGGLRIIKAGLEPHDRVIVSGVQRARPGGKVTTEAVTLSMVTD